MLNNVGMELTEISKSNWIKDKVMEKVRNIQI